MRRISLLDTGRFFAAIIVLCFHYFYNGITNGKVEAIGYTQPLSMISRYGYIGVPFFFMISGYVIFYSAINKSAYEFLTSRAKRLYPAYWIAIIFTSAITYLLGRNSDMMVSAKQIIVNFTMLQNYLGVKNVDGVYWTLFYELKFYMTVFGILFFFNERSLLFFFKLWPFLILISNLTGHLTSLFDLQFSYFAFGVLIALFNSDKSFTLIMSLVTSMALSAYTINQKSLSIVDTWIFVSLISLFFIFFYSLTFEKIRNINIRYSYILGALTYPVYLIHAHFGYLCLENFATESNKIIIYSAIIVTVFIVAYSIHYFIELKLKDKWNQFFNRLLSPLNILEEKYKKALYSAKALPKN